MIFGFHYTADCKGQRRSSRPRSSASTPARHHRRAQQSARIKRRPDQYRGEKLSVSTVLLIATGLALSSIIANPNRLPSGAAGAPEKRQMAQDFAATARAQNSSAIALPVDTNLAFTLPPLPTRSFNNIKSRLVVMQAEFPIPLYLPDHILPPLPKLSLPAQYPLALKLPPAPALARLTPPLPEKRPARAPIDLAVARPPFPIKLNFPDKVLPPAPKLPPVAQYPVTLDPLTLDPAKLTLRQNTSVASSALARPQGLAIKAIAQKKVVLRASLLPRPGLLIAALAAIRKNKKKNKTAKVCKVTKKAPPLLGTAANDTIPIEHSPLQKASWQTDVIASRATRDRAFRLNLVAAATEQMGDMTYYNPAYISLSYPMGDVPSAYGVCSDVIVRAYRRLGIDLQELVHRARVGSGDANIDHRRTSVLRKFFRRFGETLPITDYPEDYKPGDIVTYHRPFGRTSNSHIAIVSNELAPSGRPYVLHNRAWGVQKEDALFSDKITGHYRFTTLHRRRLMPPRRPRLLLAATAKPKGRRSKRSARRIATRSLKRAKRRRISLCSPLQPIAVQRRVADLCARKGQGAMALGMAKRSKRSKRSKRAKR